MKNYEFNDWGHAPGQPHAAGKPPGLSDERLAPSQPAVLAAQVIRSLLATLVALGTVLLAVLGLEKGSTTSIVQATGMAAGFVLLALAVDDNQGRAGSLALSGLAAVVLALLSQWFAVELIVLTATILAVWSAIWVMHGWE